MIDILQPPRQLYKSNKNNDLRFFDIFQSIFSANFLENFLIFCFLNPKFAETIFTCLFFFSLSFFFLYQRQLSGQFSLI